MEKTNSNMDLLKSLGRNIKNIFVGSHRGEDFILENIEKTDKKEPKMPEKTNDMGVDPNEWFNDHYMPELGEPPDLAPSSYEPPTDDDWFSTPHNEEEEEITMHEKMYRMATARYNPFSIGGSENCDSDISCNNLGGSEQIQK